ncbi:uncharacterized protein HaLaN_24044 [Haematococcus lacustris]|uniref:Uncharacterized protein n=1 Tax=Haematococcus lacustris TaxID=44745 RepID=A0A6A0A4N2_HAELA|nr:uncharacterized protein HaLaN_24044 [Haematococcus lacustris]
MSQHADRWFSTGKLANKGFAFERTGLRGRTNGVGTDPGITQAVSAASAAATPKQSVQPPVASTDQAPSPAPGSSQLNLKHITATLATWDAVWEVYLDPKWVWQRLRLYGAQDRAQEQFLKKLEKEMAEVSMKRHKRAKQLVLFFGAAGVGTGGGWGVDAVLRGYCKVVCLAQGRRPGRGRVMLVDEHRTSQPWRNSARCHRWARLHPVSATDAEEPETTQDALDAGLRLTADGRWSDALELFERALTLPGTGIKRFRDKPKLASDREKMTALYNISCCHSQLGDVRSGLVALAGCLEVGYADFEQIRRDPDLATLRKDERFDGLLKRFEPSGMSAAMGFDLSSLFGKK